MTGYFPHYPTPVDELVGIAAGLLRTADDLDPLVRDVQSGVDRATDAMEGDITFPMERAPEPVVRAGTGLAETAWFAAGAILFFADAVETYNDGIDNLNAQVPAAGGQFHDLELQQEGLKARLDDDAATAANMLNRGPNVRDLRFLQTHGCMPSIVGMDPMPHGNGPEAMRQWWDSLTLAQQAACMARRPRWLGNTDGLPAEVRDEANRLVMADDLERLAQKERDGTLTALDMAARAHIINVMRQLQQREAHIDPVTGQHTRAQLYVYDPYAFDQGLYVKGRFAIATGNMDEADHVAVMVPGMNSNVEGTGPGRSFNVYDESRWASGDSVAVLDWIGYDSPDLIESTELDKAEAGAQLLADDVDGLRASRSGNPAHLTVIGDSYGSTTVGISADPEFGLAADDLILTGSPGVPVDDAGDLTTGHDHTWVGSGSRDLVSYLGVTGWTDPTEILAETLPDVGPIPDVETLGNDPAEDTFGANRFQAEHVDRRGFLNWDPDHLRYYRSNTESLYNIAAITTGQYGDVRNAEHRYDPLADVDVDAGIESGPFGIPIPDVDVNIKLGVQDPENDREPEHLTHSNSNP